MTALGFCWFVCGWLAAAATFEIVAHHYGYAAFNGAFGVVAALIAWLELR